jgi:glycerate 2-kinase
VSAPRWPELPADLAALHGAALAAADPAAAVRRALDSDSEGVVVGSERLPLATGSRLWLISAGKAALGMADAAIDRLGTRVRAGVLAHPPGSPDPRESHAGWPAGVRRFVAGHPLPDEGSLAAGEAVRQLLSQAGAGDLVLVLLSGGASALLESPSNGLSLDELRGVTRWLQRAGADIVELNAVRCRLSQLKGGGLARRAAPARVVTLAISDVGGDRPDLIGSGPTVPPATSVREARALLDRTGAAEAFPKVAARLHAFESDAPVDPASGHYLVIGSNRDAAEAVARCASARGFRAQVVAAPLEGEAREAGHRIGALLSAAAGEGDRLASPVCLVFGGETTVTVRGHGSGGRNQELALGAARAIAGQPRTAVFAFATDGVDGASSAAGAVVTGDTLARASALGLSIERALADNDSAPFFHALGDAWHSGPTGTNVNDLAVGLIYP